MKQPLADLRIVAVEHYGAVPYGTQLLAALGADVIRVESPDGGDTARDVGPHRLGPHDSQFFQTFNRGKRSVVLDLKAPEGRAAFERLAATADAVANNLRGDQPAKLGLHYASLRRVRTDLVCAHLSAYGRDGPRAGRPGYDYLFQAEAGFLSLTGEPDGPPTRFGLSMVDYMSGTMLALVMLAAVHGARRTGEGCDVDVSLLETALHQLTYPATWYLNEGTRTERLPRGAHPSVVPSQLFPTADGWLLLMCQLPKFWEAFCRAVGREDWLTLPAFATPDARRENRALVQAELDALFATRTTAAWLELLEGRVPIAPVHDLAQALESPAAAAMIETVEHEARPGGLRLLREPFRIDGERPSLRRAPRLGEHTREVLAELDERPPAARRT